MGDNMSDSKYFRSGFTVIELIVSVVIILGLGFLFAVGCSDDDKSDNDKDKDKSYFGTLFEFKEKAREIVCKTRLKGFNTALILYTEFNDGAYPSLGPGTSLTDEPVAGNFTNAANSNLQAYALLIVEESDLSPMQFKCPSDRAYRAPKDPAIGFDAKENSSYSFQPSGAGSNNLPYLQNDTPGGAMIVGDRRPTENGWVSGNHKAGGNYITFNGSSVWRKTSKCGLMVNDVYRAQR